MYFLVIPGAIGKRFDSEYLTGPQFHSGHRVPLVSVMQLHSCSKVDLADRVMSS